MMYAVALMVGGKAGREVAGLQARYAGSMRYAIAPHVTLKYPFTLKADIGAVEASLEEVARHRKPFWVVFDGVRYFEGTNNVAYVAVRDRAPIFDLHMAVTQALQGLVEGDATYDSENFVPHMTIGVEIPGSFLPTLKDELASFEAQGRVRMTSFTLFAAEPDPKFETWHAARVFRFGSEEHRLASNE